MLLSWCSPRKRQRYLRELALVERELEAVVALYPGRLGEACTSMLAAGGKRLRPLLTLICTRRRGEPDERILRAAAAVELLHMASLAHDDVIDRAALRRGRPTVASEYGVEMAISVGNYLLAKAFSLLVSVGDEEAISLFSDVAIALSDGEILQRDDAHRIDITPADYVRRCECKTAELFSAACRLGASLSGASAQAVAASSEYGRLIGLAFQIFDDILDVTGDERATGKNRTVDVRDGTITLPLIFALESDPELAPLLSDPSPSPEVVERVVAAVLRNGAVGRAREVALGYIEEAQAVAIGCPELAEQQLLVSLSRYVVDRYR